MKKLLICSVALLFGMSVYAAADYQGYGKCVESHKAEIEKMKTSCDTEAKALANKTECTKLSMIALKCQCDNGMGTPAACDQIKASAGAKKVSKAKK
ncbi:MAG: hypothetical protein NTY22_06415 [Proteobacteria bacterium]|nr:hypothetical protein [Pseudomonadota bacterium]